MSHASIAFALHHACLVLDYFRNRFGLGGANHIRLRVTLLEMRLFDGRLVSELEAVLLLLGLQILLMVGGGGQLGRRGEVQVTGSVRRSRRVSQLELLRGWVLVLRALLLHIPMRLLSDFVLQWGLSSIIEDSIGKGCGTGGQVLHLRGVLRVDG